jgi:hypothetical protein
MQGRAFLDLARQLAFGPTEAHWRGAAIHAYYALFLECRDALRAWGRTAPPRQNVHVFVRLQFVFASEPDLKLIADDLEVLLRYRNQASYELGPSLTFSTRRIALGLVDRATVALALLAAILADPSRLAAAIASLPPP